MHLSAGWKMVIDLTNVRQSHARVDESLELGLPNINNALPKVVVRPYQSAIQPF